MALSDEICAAAAAGAGDLTDAERTLLESLCRAAEAALSARLRDGVSETDCRDAFVCAAAWTALSHFMTGARADGVTGFAAGDLKITRESGDAADGLLGRAELLMAPYVRDSFSFRGVRG
jgi:hypothetical protein